MELLASLLTLALLVALVVFIIRGSDGFKDLGRRALGAGEGPAAPRGLSAVVVLITFEVGQAVASGAQLFGGFLGDVSAAWVIALLAVALVAGALTGPWGTAALTVVGLTLGFFNLLAQFGPATAVLVLVATLLLLALVGLVARLSPLR